MGHTYAFHSFVALSVAKICRDTIVQGLFPQKTQLLIYPQMISRDSGLSCKCCTFLGSNRHRSLSYSSFLMG